MTLMTSKTIFRVGLALFVFVGLLAVPGFAAEPETGAAATTEPAAPAGSPWKPLVAIGAGLVTLGAAFGIGRLASSAMEGTARQPRGRRRDPDLDDHRGRADRGLHALRARRLSASGALSPTCLQGWKV
jgi:hypothetical protein